jgi:hypothetical protein
MADSGVDDLCRSWLDLRWHLDPAAASHAGIREHDGRLGDFEADALRPTLAALRALTAAAEDLDVEALGDEIDRTALLETMRMQLQRFEREEPQRRNPAFWLTHLFEAFYALDRRTGPPAAIAGSLLDRLQATPVFLDRALKTMSHPPLVFIDHALAMLGGGGELIARVAARCASADATLAAELTQAATNALSALRQFGENLNRTLEPDQDPQAFAIGEENFARRLHHEHALRASPPELHRYALHAREEIIRALRKEAALFDEHRPWQDVVAELATHRPLDEHLVGVMRGELQRAAEYVADRELVTVPGPMPDVILLPAHRQMLGDTAEYLMPGGGEDAPPGAIALGTEGRASLPMIPALAAQLGLPGRHVLELHARSASSEVRRTLRSVAMTEGWSLYCVDVMDEEAYIGRVGDRLFRLVLRLHAILRLEIDIGLHTRNLSRIDAIELLCSHLPMDRRMADAEVRRLCAEPATGVAAAAGHRELHALRDTAKRERGSAFRIGGFHADVLAYGALPPALIRWGMGYSE